MDPRTRYSHRLHPKKLLEQNVSVLVSDDLSLHWLSLIPTTLFDLPETGSAIQGFA